MLTFGKPVTNGEELIRWTLKSKKFTLSVATPYHLKNDVESINIKHIFIKTKL